MEHLLGLPEEKQAVLLAQNPALRISLGNYTSAKTAFERLQEMSQ